jgi:hypothetical protein
VGDVTPEPPCAEILDFDYSAGIPGSEYHAGGQNFSGTVNLTMSLAPVSGHHYFEGPEGTYGEDPDCDPGSLGDPWPVTGTTLGSGSGYVACYDFRWDLLSDKL